MTGENDHVNDPLLIKDQEPHPSERSGKSAEYVTAGTHPNEEERIARLMGYEILDDESDPVLEGIAELAALSCSAPIAIVSLVAEKQTVFRATYGIKRTSTPRDASLCAFSILEPENLLIIPDTHKDSRFSNNPYVTGKPFVRFYAGAPLWSEDHLPIGSLCVIDHEPRELGEKEKEMLVKISRIAMARITARRYRKTLEHLLNIEKTIYSKFLHSTSAMALGAPSFDKALHNLMETLDPNLGWLSARVRNMQTGSTTGIIDNPVFLKSRNLSEIWQKIDRSASYPAPRDPVTDFIKSDELASYSHLVVPVRVRNRLVAILEFLYPDHRSTDPRIREVFDIMASNLSVVAERELIHIELHHQATHDSLTDTANRRVVISEIQQSLLNADPIKPDAAVIFLDVDGFKEINDNFGHEKGDQLLIEISNRLRGIAREGDVVGRLSGDEFVLILRNLLNPGDLPKVLDRLWKSLSHSYHVGDLKIRVTNSIGCTLLNESEINPNEVLRRAEEAMYLVKNGHRKKYCIVDEWVIREMHQKRHLDHLVSEAVKDNRMSLLYQPIVDLRTGKIAGAEALFRLFQRDGTMMPAVEFMESLKRSKHLPMIDEWVFSEACRVFSAQGAALLRIPGFRFSVNVSPPILSSKGYATHCLEEMDHAGIPPACLTVEIVENDFLTSNDTVMENISLLREKGARIAIDDFGTGYSNLQYLSSLPVDCVKIDKSFLTGIKAGDAKKNSLLASIVGISIGLGYTTIVEGLEESLQEDYIRKLGNCLGQGYLYGKPMPIEDLIALSRKDFSKEEFPGPQ